MDCELHRLEVELEEDSRRATMVVQGPSVMSDAVLMCVERLRTGCNVRRWHNMQEVLICNKCYQKGMRWTAQQTSIEERTIVSELKGVVQWLGDVGEVGSKRELGNHMG